MKVLFLFVLAVVFTIANANEELAKEKNQKLQSLMDSKMKVDFVIKKLIDNKEFELVEKVKIFSKILVNFYGHCDRNFNLKSFRKMFADTIKQLNLIAESLVQNNRSILDFDEFLKNLANDEQYQLSVLHLLLKQSILHVQAKFDNDRYNEKLLAELEQLKYMQKLIEYSIDFSGFSYNWNKSAVENLIYTTIRLLKNYADFIDLKSIDELGIDLNKPVFFDEFTIKLYESEILNNRLNVINMILISEAKEGTDQEKKYSDAIKFKKMLLDYVNGLIGYQKRETDKYYKPINSFEKILRNEL